ncbi:hypothetical protein [Hymenobacter rubripertinctus]|uniref:Uncharacterized protein n=1 Tax=Hymenobacter rubripertinctus TaxID=2029981 RepID=A0A418R998_9BACT|nr:hypothetical protein [Hymenobacter rubripertinctus]RIY13832.1 hypothetical protein D0T11_01760 [Hymenobacter rubripertinctus]
MNPDYALLTTRAECDAATADVTFELKTFSYRDTGLDIADERASRSQISGAAALAKKDGEILIAQGQAALAGLSAEQQQDANDALELLQAQRKKIMKGNRTSAGTDRFLSTVDAAQVQSQVDVLTAVLSGIAAHRATLPA